MTLFDLLFLASVLGSVIALLVASVALARRRWAVARGTLTGLGVYALLYAVALVSVSVFTPQQSLAMGQERCFDDWCIVVAHAAQQATIGAGAAEVSAQGRFTVVTVRVSSHAKAISQRELDTQLSLVDGAGRRYDVSAAGQRALDASGESGQPLNTLLPPGGSFLRTVAFDTPIDASQLSLVVAHPAFPGVLIIGSEQSPFHRPALMRLSFAS